MTTTTVILFTKLAWLTTTIKAMTRPSNLKLPMWFEMPELFCGFEHQLYTRRVRVAPRKFIVVFYLFKIHVNKNLITCEMSRMRDRTNLGNLFDTRKLLCFRKALGRKDAMCKKQHNADHPLTHLLCFVTRNFTVVSNSCRSTHSWPTGCVRDTIYFQVWNIWFGVEKYI